jgi:hypothetical protein
MVAKLPDSIEQNVFGWALSHYLLSILTISDVISFILILRFSGCADRPTPATQHVAVVIHPKHIKTTFGRSHLNPSTRS